MMPRNATALTLFSTLFTLAACGDSASGTAGSSQGGSGPTAGGGGSSDDGGSPSDGGGPSNGGTSSDGGSPSEGGAPPMGPDLTPDAWSLSYYSPAPLDTNVTICINMLKDGSPDDAGAFVDILNAGNEDAPTYEVALGIQSASGDASYYCDDRLYLDGTHAAGDTATWDGPFCCAISTVSVPDGSFKLVVNADVGNVIEELDEENNLSLSDGTFEVVTILGSCQGTPTPCSQRSLSDCDNGCYQDAECNGSAYSCSSYFGYASCEQQDGCYYNGLYPNGYCSGSADSCSSESSEYSCESQDGCYWDDICSGTPDTCATFGTPSDCTTQLGCSWY